LSTAAAPSVERIVLEALRGADSSYS
jgi:hypothetical protein